MSGGDRDLLDLVSFVFSLIPPCSVVQPLTDICLTQLSLVLGRDPGAEGYVSFPY